MARRPVSVSLRSTTNGCVPVLLLASASSARRRLLEQAGIPHRVRVSGVDERAISAPEPSLLVQRLAEAKAMAVHLNRILARFDGTVHAQRARKELLALGTEYASGRWMASEIRAAGNPLPVASVDAVDPVTPTPTSTPAAFPSRTELEAPDTTPVVPSGPQFPAQPEPEPELGSAPEFQPPETAAEPESSVREIPSM